MQNQTIISLCAFILCLSMQAAQKNLEESAYKKAKTVDWQRLNITDASFKLLMSIPSNDQTKMHRAINNGADVNFKEPSTEKTSLMLAAECAHLEIIKVLINHKADVLCKDYTGNTALDYAKQHLEQAKQSVRILEEIHKQQTQINSRTHEETNLNRMMQEYADQLRHTMEPIITQIPVTTFNQNFFNPVLAMPSYILPNNTSSTDSDSLSLPPYSPTPISDTQLHEQNFFQTYTQSS